MRIVVLFEGSVLVFQSVGLAVFICLLPNAKVSDGSQPPMTLYMSLRESAGSRSLDSLVGPCSGAAAEAPPNQGREKG